MDCAVVVGSNFYRRAFRNGVVFTIFACQRYFFTSNERLPPCTILSCHRCGTYFSAKQPVGHICCETGYFGRVEIFVGLRDNRNLQQQRQQRQQPQPQQQQQQQQPRTGAASNSPLPQNPIRILLRHHFRTVLRQGQEPESHLDESRKNHRTRRKGSKRTPPLTAASPTIAALYGCAPLLPGSKQETVGFRPVPCTKFPQHIEPVDIQFCRLSCTKVFPNEAIYT